ncbi:MAG: bifunctional methylenetetrahydrofolate dehydrogenase/methenyltetrahydrofolate cyclohydrolase FolD [Vicinamibacteria bacterium]
MTARILDGASIARQIRAEVRLETLSFVEGGGPRPGLGALLVGDDPASHIYVSSKTKACEELGLHHVTERLPATATTDEVLEVVQRFNHDPRIHGILVQLPLPKQVDAIRVLDAVSPRKDVDGFHPENVGLLSQGRVRFAPCTPAGVMEMLRREKIEIAGKRAVVVGRSDIVGKPMALLLLHAHATVTIAHSRTRDLADLTRTADLLIAAAGKPALIRAEHVREGAVVIDVGIHRIISEIDARKMLSSARLAKFDPTKGSVVGDVHWPSVSEVASALTPVPGGVGPLTIAMLMSNTLKGAKLFA